ncbi:hypothetical protein ACF0H5_010519 [Mactra antiquata]
MKPFKLTTMITLAMFISVASAKLFTIQFDLQRNKENHPIWDLTNTSNGHALMLEPGKTLTHNFCLRTDSYVTVKDFRFSNGNRSEQVMLEIDRVLMGAFRTPTNPQHSWNLFLSTGRFPRVPLISIGWHRLVVKFNGTADGIALDYIELDIDDDKMSQDIFSCELTCIPDRNYNVRSNPVVTEASYIVQESYKTACPEVDNINVPIFNPSVQMYEITAALPQYRAFYNWKNENTTGCPHLSPLYWSFNNIDLTSSANYAIDTPSAKIYFSRGNDRHSKVHTSMVIAFKLEGKSKGMIDSEMGAILKIKFRHLTNDVKLSFRYKGRHNGLSRTVINHATPTHPETEWNIPDFSWTDKDYNLVFLYVVSNSSKPLHMEHLFLERRPMLPDQVKSVYRSDDSIIEVVFSDFWWLNPDSMTVHLSTGDIYHNVSYFRIYRPIPWDQGYAQVFVLYQDGNARLLPVPPVGLKGWIPFGSSVIIGQTDPTVVRPYASITDTYIDVDKQVMSLMYKDGGSCRLSLLSSLTETRVVVSDLYLARNPALFPFTTFRSMYVAEGNTDVDHVKVDGIHNLHIMDDFNAVIGRNFVFHRKCMSRHLNLSPDIYIDIRRTLNDNAHVELIDTDAFQSLLMRIRNHRFRLWTPRLRYNYG